jgi:tetratricopeptide (TPR) repeat protein
LIFFDTPSVHESQYLNYLVCMRALNEYEAAIFAYEHSFPDHIKNNSAIINEMGNISFELGAYTKALDYYEKCIASFSDSLIYDKSLLMKGLIYANEKQWDKSHTMFMSVSDNSIFSYSKNNCLSILQQKENISYKKPYLAGIYAIVPGLGYVYAGHRQTALSSLIINGLLAYATYTNCKNENYGMAALTGLFSFSFYIGNISGSVKSAKRYNTKQDQNITNRLKSTIYY